MKCIDIHFGFWLKCIPSESGRKKNAVCSLFFGWSFWWFFFSFSTAFFCEVATLHGKHFCIGQKTFSHFHPHFSYMWNTFFYPCAHSRNRFKLSIVYHCGKCSSYTKHLLLATLINVTCSNRNSIKISLSWYFSFSSLYCLNRSLDRNVQSWNSNIILTCWITHNYTHRATKCM